MKRTQLKRGKPLRSKRPTPRRNEGRVTHVRIKPRPSAPPNKEERQHHARVAAMPCLVCGHWPVTNHHVSASIHGGRITRSHKRIVPLCNDTTTGPHHQAVYDKVSDPRSVELLGHGGFFRKYGIDLLAVADRLWKESENGAAAV